MNEEIRCIINEEKTAKNEWENDGSDFLRAYTVYMKKSGQFFFHIFEKLNKTIKIFEQLNKASIKRVVLTF